MPRGSSALRLVDAVETVDRGVTTSARTAGHHGTDLERFRRHYDVAFDRKWQAEAMGQVCSLVDLPVGWDGNCAPAVRRDAGMFMLEALVKVMLPGTPSAQIVPTSVGGVQIEWHEAGIDLEFHVAAPYQCELWFEDHAGEHQPVSIELTGDFSALQAAVARLTRRI